MVGENARCPRKFIEQSWGQGNILYMRPNFGKSCKIQVFGSILKIWALLMSVFRVPVALRALAVVIAKLPGSHQVTRRACLESNSTFRTRENCWSGGKLKIYGLDIFVLFGQFFGHSSATTNSN